MTSHDDDLIRAGERAEPPYMDRVAAVEEVDPDAAVDDDHPAARPLRLRESCRASGVSKDEWRQPGLVVRDGATRLLTMRV